MDKRGREIREANKGRELNVIIICDYMYGTVKIQKLIKVKNRKILTQDLTSVCLKTTQRIFILIWFKSHRIR